MSEVSSMFGPSGYAEAKTNLFGIECEIESINDYSNIGKSWQSTDDQSLRNNGLEFISKPISLVAATKSFEQLHAGIVLTNKTEAFSQRTSIHVHLNCQDMSVAELTRMLHLYILYEEAYFAMCDPARRHNIHCVALTETFLPRYYGGAINSLYQRWTKYTALNIKPLTKYGTVEFRHMHGHGDTKLFAEWLNVLNTLKEVAKEQIANNVPLEYGQMGDLEATYDKLFASWSGRATNKHKLQQWTFNTSIDLCFAN